MSEANTKQSSPPRLDALGFVALATYALVSGVFVFGFGNSMESAVRTQNETPCRSLRPYHARVTGRVLDAGGTPAAGAEIVPVVDGRSGMPIKANPESGEFSVFFPKGAQALRISAPGKESIEAGVVLGPSELVDVKITLDDEGKTGGDLEELARAPWEAPEITVEDREGNRAQLSDYRGQLVVLNFWATWCEPCITEWPQIDKLADRIASRSDVAVLAVSIDGEKDDIAPFLGRMSLDETKAQVMWDPSAEVHRAFGSEQIPDTYFIDESGRVHSVFVNTREWGSPDALHCLESSLGR